MQEEITTVKKERDEYKKKLERRESAFQKEKRTGIQGVRKAADLQQQLDLALQDQQGAVAKAERLEQDLDAAKKQIHVATSTLARSKADLAHVQSQKDSAIKLLEVATSSFQVASMTN